MKKLEKLNNSKNQTPIEVALEIDENGMTTARKLYEFLELHPAHFAKWCRKNIAENVFAVETLDFIRLTLKGETPTGGVVERVDYKLTADFAKKLCMTSKTERGEQARNYFIKVEEAFKNVIAQEQAGQQQYYYFDSVPYTTVKDIASSFGCNTSTIGRYMKKYLKYGVDYLLLQGSKLIDFKYLYPAFRAAKAMYIITMSGFDKIKKYLQMLGYTSNEADILEEYFQVTPDYISRDTAELIIKRYLSLTDVEKYKSHITRTSKLSLMKTEVETFSYVVSELAKEIYNKVSKIDTNQDLLKLDDLLDNLIKI